jgi:hypothetical protein
MSALRRSTRSMLLPPLAAAGGWLAGIGVYAAGMGSLFVMLVLWMFAPPLIALIDRRNPLPACVAFFAAAITANQLRQFAFYRAHGFDIDREIDKHWPMWITAAAISLCACAWGSLFAWALRRRGTAQPS